MARHPRSFERSSVKIRMDEVNSHVVFMGYFSRIQTMDAGTGGAGGVPGSGGGGGATGGCRLNRAKFGIASIGEPFANCPRMTVTPPRRSRPHSVVSGEPGSS